MSSKIGLETKHSSTELAFSAIVMPQGLHL